jgi:hypothetical protein
MNVVTRMLWIAVMLARTLLLANFTLQASAHRVIDTVFTELRGQW